MYLVKLGGSIITDKSRPYEARIENIHRLGREIKDSGVSVVLVHGAGSFGHPKAKKYAIHLGYHDPEQIPVVSKIQRDVRKLNLMLLDAFQDEGLSPISMPPGMNVQCDNSLITSMDFRPYHSYLELGMMPVTFGDVVPDSAMRFCICSGDQLILWLARELKPEGVIFAADVDGVYDSDPAANGDARLIDTLHVNDITNVESGSTVDDVTGAMRGKLENMAAIHAAGTAVKIINGTVAGRLQAALTGDAVTGTVLEG